MGKFVKNTNLFIAVNPVGSKFAKALQAGLKEIGYRVLRCSVTKGVDHKRRGRKVFNVTQQTLDKVQQFSRFTAHGVVCPEYTTDRNKLDSLGIKTIFARTLINSTSGKGIVEFQYEVGGSVPNAPLYTAYIPKKAEYRVHVFNGKVLDVQQKKKKLGFEGDRDTRIRNLSNGYVYTRDNIVEPEGLRQLGIDAVAAVGYSYGAVDIIYNQKRNACFVLEVNSRPGLMGTTLVNYVNALKEIL